MVDSSKWTLGVYGTGGWGGGVWLFELGGGGGIFLVGVGVFNAGHRVAT